MCYIADGRAGACDRYANEGGDLVRLDPHVILEASDTAVSFLGANWQGEIVHQKQDFVTAIGAGTTYPDYKPAPFIVQSQIGGLDTVTVVTEGIFSYCGAKVKIDTDRHLGPEQAAVRVEGEAIGHVTTAEYGSQMLSLGGVQHLTGGSKKEGRVTCNALLTLCNRGEITVEIDGGAELTLSAGKAPIVNGQPEEKMRVGCGSAAVGMFASQWKGLVDEVVVVDDHITGVMSEHQAGKVIGWQPTGIRIKGRRSTPGRYFQVAAPGTGWGGTDLQDPLAILDSFKPDQARAGQTLLMVSTTGEHAAFFRLNADLIPIEEAMPSELLPSVERITENCEPALTSVLFMGGAGGSLRSGVTDNPVQLTRAVKSAITRVTCGGAPVYTWPGGGITVMVDVTQLPENAFGYVPTPALVAPIEFTMGLQDFADLGGHMEHITSLNDAVNGRVGPQNDHRLAGQKRISRS